MKQITKFAAFALAAGFALVGCNNKKADSNTVDDSTPTHTHTIGDNSVVCTGCGKYIIDGAEYDLTHCEYNSNDCEGLPTYANPKVNLKAGKNLLRVDYPDDGEDEWRFFQGSGFSFAFYQSADALSASDYSQLVTGETVALYDYKGANLGSDNTGVGHYNFYGTATEETFYNDVAYLLVEVTQDVTTFVFCGNC